MAFSAIAVWCVGFMAGCGSDGSGPGSGLTVSPPSPATGSVAGTAATSGAGGVGVSAGSGASQPPGTAGTASNAGGTAAPAGGAGGMAAIPPAGAGASGTPAAGGAGGAMGPRVPGMGTCLQGSGNYESDGPYSGAMMDVELPNGLGPYTIFYPSNMEADCPHPIVAWGNGTGVTGSGTYAAYHRRAASWGIVTIAAHNSNAGSMKYLEGGLDYLIAENANPSSMFHNKLSPRAGVGGHSQGGIAATTAAAHPNVEAEVCVEGGGFGVGAKVAFMCQTGVDDFLRSMCTSAYQGAAGPAFLLDHQMADHISTPTIGLTTSEAGMQFVRTSTAWYRCWLADDETACALFQGGGSAPVCGDSMWATCESRNF